MAKRLNKGLVAGLTFGVFLLTTVTGVLLVLALQIQDPADFVNRAKAAAAEKNWEAAKRYYYRAYTVSKPKDAKFLVAAGQVAYDGGLTTDAYRFWYDAKVQDPQLRETRQKLLDLLLEIARMEPVTATHWTQVKEEADGILALDQTDLRARFGRGFALARLKADDPGNLDLGMEALHGVVEAAPAEIDYTITLAYLYVDKAREMGMAAGDLSVRFARSAEELRKAEKLYRDLLAQHPKPGPEASEARWQFGKFLDDYVRILESWKRDESAQARLSDEAKSMFEEAVAFAADDPEALTVAKLEAGNSWGRRWQRLRNTKSDDPQAQHYFEEARQQLLETITLDPDGLEPYRSLAGLYSESKMYDEAVQVCRKRLDLPIERTGLKATQQKILRYMILLQACESSVEHAENLSKTEPKRPELLSQAQQFIDDAEAEYRGDAVGSHWAGRIHLAQDQELEAISLFREAEERFQSTGTNLFFFGKDRLMNSYLLAQLQLKRDQPGAARQTVERALQLAPDNPALWSLMSRVRLKLGELDSALQAAEQAASLDRTLTEALDVMIEVNRQLGRTEKVKELLAQRPGDTRENAIRQAEVLALEGKTREALDLILPLLELSPADTDLVRRASWLCMQHNDNAQAAQIVQRAMTLDPGNLRLKAFALATDMSLSPEERDAKQMALIDEIEDLFSRSLQKAVWLLGKKRDAEVLAELDNTLRLVLEKGSPAAINQGSRYLSPILDTIFILAARKRDWSAIDEATRTATEQNVDGADGKSYVGLGHMFRASFIEGDTPEARSQRKEQWELAAESFRQARAAQPADARNLTRLGQSYMALDRTLDSREALESAIAANPKNSDAQKTLTMLASRMNDDDLYDKHLAVCEELIPNDPWVKEALFAQKEAKNPTEGIPRRLAIRKEKPDDLNNLMKLADLYRRAEQNTEAAECYEAALLLKPADRAVVYTASSFFRKKDNPQRALEVLRKYVDAQPDAAQKAEAQLLVGQHYAQISDHAAADEAYAQAADTSQTLKVCMGVAYHYYNTARYEKAMEWQEKAVKIADASEPAQAPVLRRMAVDCLLKLNEKVKAVAAIEDYQSRYPDDPPGWLMRGEVEFARGHIDEAIAAVDRYLQERPQDPQAMFQRAEYQLSQGRWAAAIRDLETLRAADPDLFNFAPRLRLAEAYDLNGQSDQALSELQSIIDAHPDALEVARKLVELHFKRERFADAHRVLTGLINRFPDQSEWYALRARASDGLDNRPLALSDGRKAVELSGFNPSFVDALMDLFLEYKMLDEGISFFTETVPADKRTPSGRYRHASLLAAKGNEDAALLEYRTAMSNPADLDVNEVRRLFSDLVRTFPGEKEIDLFQKSSPDEAHKRANDLILAGLLNAHQRNSEAIAILENLLRSTTVEQEKLLIVSLLGDSYSAAENHAEAKKYYEKAIEIDPNSWASLNNLAYLLAEYLHEPAQALPYAKKAALAVTRLGTVGGVAPSERATVFDTLGWVHFRLEQYDDAIGELSRGIQADPRVLVNYIHLGEVYRRKGRFEQARLVLDHAQQLADALGFPAEHPDRQQLAESLRKVINLEQN